LMVHLPFGVGIFTVKSCGNRVWLAPAATDFRTGNGFPGTCVANRTSMEDA
jgi:hypothetical protein